MDTGTNAPLDGVSRFLHLGLAVFGVWAKLKAFHDGTRVNPIMSPMAKGLSDTDIANLAVYLSALKTPQPARRC